MNSEIGVITPSFLKNNSVYFFISGMLGLPCCMGSSLVAVRSYSQVVALGLLTVVPSLVAEHGL